MGSRSVPATVLQRNYEFEVLMTELAMSAFYRSTVSSISKTIPSIMVLVHDALRDTYDVIGHDDDVHGGADHEVGHGNRAGLGAHLVVETRVEPGSLATL